LCLNAGNNKFLDISNVTLNNIDGKVL
jgi:hypothetical protein